MFAVGQRPRPGPEMGILVIRGGSEADQLRRQLDSVCGRRNSSGGCSLSWVAASGGASQKLVDEFGLGGRSVGQGLDVLWRLAQGAEEASDLGEVKCEGTDLHS